MTETLKPYINSLIQNIDHTNIPDEIDVIFDSGALNGFMAQGVAMYLKTLEEMNHTKVRRISGCSAGAMVGLIYFIDIFLDLTPMFERTIEHFHTHRNFAEFIPQLKNIIYEHLTDDLSLLNGRLYITYYDTETKGQVVVSEYADRDELLEIITRSSHIPYISTPVLKYKERYVDGIAPYIFEPGERRAFFVKVVVYNNVFRLINIRNEANPCSRVLDGLADANAFFTCGRSAMCSYVDTWRVERFLIKVRIFIFLAFVWILDHFTFIYHLAPKMGHLIYNFVIDWLKN